MTVVCRRLASLCLCLLPALAGCGGSRTQPELVWGRFGGRDGDFNKPRAAAIDAHDRLYIVDFSARVQVYDRDGHYLNLTWRTPDWNNGKPSGLSIDRDGNLLLSDSHYHCLRVYGLDGTLLKTLGLPAGSEPGQFGYLGDAVQDEDGYYYVAEFGETSRITKLNADGTFLKCWGALGTAPGEFSRVRALTFRPNDPDKLLYLADAANHRIQVFTRDGALVDCWGVAGSAPGELSYPYDLAFSPKGDVLYVVEFGNQRVQKFTPEGKSLGCWGSPGRGPGQFYQPWALVVDSRGRVHVIDSQNHRVQRIDF